MSRLRVLIVGGYGFFGGRLARLLADEARLTLVIAGRSEAKARAFAAGLGGAASVEAIAFDRTAPEAALRTLAPDIVIDASGPFQTYADDPYGLVRAAIACGAGYLDLADGAEFVEGIARFDAEAKARGVFVLAGASSAPLLTAAAVRRLAEGMARVETIAGGIAPSPRVRLGPNVIRAIGAGVGQPVRLTRDGCPAIAYAFTEARRFTIAPPGALPLGNRRFALVDVPDLRVLPPQWPGLSDIWFGAGTVPEPLHRGLSLLGWAVRRRLIPSLAPLAPLMHRAMALAGRGEHRGGMFVEVTGHDATGDDGERAPVVRSWHMIAEGDDGPLIPALAAEGLVRRCLEGAPPVPGARAATRELELADYDRLFARHRIVTGFRGPPPEGAPLYRRLLGEAWDRLPGALQGMHDPGRVMTAAGRASVERGRNPLARLVALVFGFPPASKDIPVRVTFTAGPVGERWQRDFGGRRFASRQSEGRGRSAHLLAERFGPFVFGLALVLEGGRLRLVARRWTAFGLPMPRWLMPGGDSFETAEDGRFRFHVEIRLPLAGLVVRYRGWLEPEREETA